jgi:hypothetical protein
MARIRNPIAASPFFKVRVQAFQLKRIFFRHELDGASARATG